MHDQQVGILSLDEKLDGIWPTPAMLTLTRNWGPLLPVKETTCTLYAECIGRSLG